MNILCDEPKVFTIGNFIDKKSCDHIISVAKNKLKPALVSTAKKGVVSKGRTGMNCWIDHKHDTIFEGVAKKISELIKIPIETAESFQIIYYDKYQEYQKHTDSWAQDGSEKSKRCMRMGGQRLVTALCYLNTVEEGGTTRFTKLKIDVKPEIGKLLVFNNTFTGTNKKHPMSEHAGTPVFRGEKYAFNLWFREGNFNKVFVPKDVVAEEEKPVAVQQIKILNSFLTEKDIELLKQRRKWDSSKKTTHWEKNTDHLDLIKRIGIYLLIEFNKLESISVITYPSKTLHKSHYDAFSDERVKSEKRGQRVFTISGALDNLTYNFTKIGKFVELKQGDVIIYSNVVGSTTTRNENLSKSISNSADDFASVFHMFVREKSRNDLTNVDLKSNSVIELKESFLKSIPEEVKEVEEVEEDFAKTLKETYELFKSNKIKRTGNKSLTFSNLRIGFDIVKDVVKKLGALDSVLKKNLEKNDYVFDELTPIRIKDIYTPNATKLVKEYYNYALSNNLLPLGDRQSNRRYKARNDPVSRILHFELLPLVEKFVGKKLKPTYTYISFYKKGADLPNHNDNSNCEYTISYLIDKPENAKWNIYFDPKYSKKNAGRAKTTPSKEECIELDCDVNDLLCFCGQEHNHFREALEYEYYNVILLHYVDL